MNVSIGGGWSIHHLTDRVIELRKESYEYRRFTGRDGYVLVRVEPGMTRAEAMDKAVRMAQRNDVELSLLIGKQMIPNKAALATYTGKQLRLERTFGTGEEASVIGRRSA